MTAAYSIIDLTDPDLEFKVVHSEGADMKTPQEYIDAETNHVYMVANGGYFNMIQNVSISLVKSQGKVIAFDLSGKRQKHNGADIPYYVTPGAFGVYENGTAEVAWSYSINGDFTQVWAYPEPSPNCYGCPPQLIPDSMFPKGGYAWTVPNAVGAGPVIMKNGEVHVTHEEELVYHDNQDALNPRTGICVTHDNKMVVIVVDGRSEASGGLLIQELGELMQTLGCKDALNLDGGGSTAMIVDGFVTNHPSDKTGMRHVTSAVMVLSKTKPKKTQQTITI